ncbi:MAG TPA: hypothetical protein VF997_25260, partial [Polyangia bacterium]
MIAWLPALIAVGNADVAQAAMTDCSLVDAQGKVTLDNAAGTATFTATPIYLSGSTALEPLIKAAGPKVAQAATPYVLIYVKDGSCSGVNRINGDGKIPATASLLYVAPDADGTTSKACGASSVAVNGTLVLSDVDATLCPGITAQPAGTKDFHGPVNNMVFITPPTATTRAISAEMGYLMFGLGAAGAVTPYVDPTAYFIRTPDSGTRAMINAALGLTTHNWQGDTGVTTAKPGGYGSGDVFNKVAGAAQTAPEKTIGILGEDFYDSSSGGVSNRNQVKALAFRAFKQHLAYWPDSTLSSRDKKNVREGRYGIWGFVHMLAKATGATATDAAAQYFIDLVQGNLASPPVNALDLTIASHLTPVCAMKVTHDIEGAPSKPYTDAAPCGCYFESKATGTAPATCKTCSVD